MLKFLCGIALILCGIPVAAAGYLFYFFGGVCGRVEEGLIWFIGGLGAFIVGTALICLDARNEEKGESKKELNS